jgi:hypothetical protein
MAESVVKGEARPRPLVLLGEFWRGLVETALAEAASPDGAAALQDVVRFAATAPEAVAAALAPEGLSAPDS